MIAATVWFTQVPHGPFLEKKAGGSSAALGDNEESEEGPSQNKDFQEQEKNGNKLTTSPRYFSIALKHYKEWIPPLVPYFFSWCAHNFIQTQFYPGIVLYTLNDDQYVSFFGARLKANYFRTIMSSCCFVVDFIQRTVAEYVPDVFPVVFMLFDLAGAMMVVSGLIELTFISGIIIISASSYLY